MITKSWGQRLPAKQTTNLQQHEQQQQQQQQHNNNKRKYKCHATNYNIDHMTQRQPHMAMANTTTFHILPCNTLCGNHTTLRLRLVQSKLNKACYQSQRANNHTDNYYLWSAGDGWFFGWTKRWPFDTVCVVGKYGWRCCKQLTVKLHAYSNASVKQ